MNRTQLGPPGFTEIFVFAEIFAKLVTNKARSFAGMDVVSPRQEREY